jgi:hypothetical protein
VTEQTATPKLAIIIQQGKVLDFIDGLVCRPPILKHSRTLLLLGSGE